MPDTPAAITQTESSPHSLLPVGFREAKRTSDQVEEDLIFIAELLSKKTKAVEITRKLNEIRHGSYSLSRQQVANDIKQLERRWAHSISNKTMAEWKAKQIYTIDHLMSEAMDAWERSKRDGQSMTGNVVAAGSSNPTPTGQKVTKTRRDGDPRWIEVMRGLLEREAKVIGMDAPLKLDANVTGEGMATLEALRIAYKERIRAEVKSELPRGQIVDVETIPPTPVSG